MLTKITRLMNAGADLLLRLIPSAFPVFPS